MERDLTDYAHDVDNVAQVVTDLLADKHDTYVAAMREASRLNMRAISDDDRLAVAVFSTTVWNLSNLDDR